MTYYTIGQLAKLTGNTVVTLRYYERLGLLPEVKRSQGGFRLYPASIIPRLHFIANAKAVGFDLMAINELFQLQETKAASQLVKLKAQEKIRCIEDKIATLTAMKTALSQWERACDGKVPIDECPILTNLYHHTPGQGNK